eukprot:TRINITY_DN6666_c0_g2_i1.p2 TRINITY_DN6666_c0_g2~~TRINITY_DN6666_c0_g2_i1.p2  ORF type:complete len:115 (-),score=22.76 TRINITY_DN6666_c0_g2_i1:90-434(-)
MARSSSPLASLIICFAAAALLAVSGNSFVPGAAPSRSATQLMQRSAESSTGDVRMVSAASMAALGMPLAASADTDIPEPVLGIGFLSVIVVLVLIVSGIVVARGLIADEENGDF